MGQVAMAEESNISFMIMMARSILDLGRIQSLEEIFSRIQNTSAHDITSMACEMFEEERLSCLMMVPEQAKA